MMNDGDCEITRMSVLESFSLKGETAIVTGAAQGLGKQMATGLTDMGADVAIADVNVEKAEQTATELDGETTVIATEVDVTDEASVEEMVEEVTDRLGPVDVLVNNAGIVENAPAEETTLDSWQRVLAVNLDGVFLCAKHVGQQMLDRGEGRIVNVASMSGFDVNVPQKQASYNTTKAGVSMLTKSLAVEWADRGVRVNAIAPGYMRTDLVDEVLEANPEMEETWLENTPMGRLGRPEELRELVVYLASDASSYMTGSTVVMDGGYTSR
ncbi:3-oxoacyl-[acyl-carrier protein] reductase [Halogranum salarium B-1]|uniref:3-oxoacyl-[acyl-carrier protein] reductase n=2 Tax=Halogranum rubrum TaxID=553466 RepID=J2ZWZ0_9EURY|nr:3-oxoacyl-[acyl-carrier protein] reductase [Halogranum salarium B-1]